MSERSVNAILKERVGTTTEWAYANPILANKEKGFEVDDSYLQPVGMKMGDGVTHWNELPYWFQTPATTSVITITVTAGQNIKFTRDYIFFGYAALLGNSIDGYIVVKDLDPQDGFTVIFRKSNTALFSLTRQGDLITGNILQLYCYLEENPDNPGHTLNEQYIIIHKI